MRQHDELAEDICLTTPLEIAFNNNDEKSFELLFNFCCKHGNQHFVYKVIMRNIGTIMSVKGLNSITESFYQEEGSPISFGMKLTQKDLPQYQKQVMFRGFDKQEAGWLEQEENQKYLEQAREIYGCVSENEVIDNSMILAQIHENQ